MPAAQCSLLLLREVTPPHLDAQMLTDTPICSEERSVFGTSTVLGRVGAYVQYGPGWNTHLGACTFGTMPLVPLYQANQISHHMYLNVFDIMNVFDPGLVHCKMRNIQYGGSDNVLANVMAKHQCVSI